MLKYALKSSDGTLTGPFDTPDEALAWGNAHEDEVGDFCIEDIFDPHENGGE